MQNSTDTTKNRWNALRLYAQLFFFSSRRRHTRCSRDWSSDVCSSDLRFSLSEPVGDGKRHVSRFLNPYPAPRHVEKQKTLERLPDLRPKYHGWTGVALNGDRKSVV